MAKRKKKHHGPKRRRMSGIAGGIKEGLMHVLGVTAGVALGRYVNASFLSTMDAKLVGAGEAVAGALVAGKMKQPFIKSMGVGLGANGVLYAAGAKGLALLPASVGYGPPEVNAGFTPSLRMSGFRDVPKIGQPFPKPGNIAGMPDRERARTSRMYAGIYN
jgi:hypothetical protein